MVDRYQALARTSVGRLLVKNLGLPDPRPLRRYREGDPLVPGAVLVGGTGALTGAATAIVASAGAEAVTADADGRRYHGLVFDASNLQSSAELSCLQEFFGPALRALDADGRVVVLGTTPSHAGSPGAQVAQRALEGFTRSLGKEVGRGSTVQLVYVSPGSADRLDSTLEFLLSAKSAYVSGQVVRVGDAVAANVGDADPAHPLDGKVALVTGAARGIGAAITQVLHRDGATVVGVDIAAAAGDLQQVTGSLDADSLVVDITQVDAPERLARSLDERHGGVDIVVHNAGVTRDKRLANMGADRWNRVIDVNLRAPERINAVFAEQRTIRPGGRIVGVSSIAGIAGNLGQTNYATSKAGVIGLVDATTAEWASRDVTINAVAPGFIETAMTAAMPLALREAGRRLNSLRQGGLPVDVAETVAWYADPRSHGVTGNVVRVCGQSMVGA